MGAGREWGLWATGRKSDKSTNLNEGPPYSGPNAGGARFDGFEIVGSW